MTKEKYAILWDLDGTLVDTAEEHFEAWKTTACALGFDFGREDFDVTFGRRNPEVIRFLFGEHLSDAKIAEIATQKENLYRELAGKGVKLLKGAKEKLVEFSANGLAQAIGSSAPRENLEQILRLTGISAYFQAVVAMEDTQRGKPDPDVFLIAAEKLSVAPHGCLVIEDAPAGLRAAKTAGMRAVAVRSQGRHTDSELLQAGADQVVESLAHLSLDDVWRLLEE
jgi:beta-phosphoglucomutase